MEQTGSNVPYKLYPIQANILRGGEKKLQEISSSDNKFLGRNARKQDLETATLRMKRMYRELYQEVIRQECKQEETVTLWMNRMRRELKQ